MFQELMPLLSQRTLIVTVSRVGDERICVNVIPKVLKSDQSDQEAGLTTPLSMTGSPRELDEQFPAQLTGFVEAHVELSSTLQSAKEQIEAAAKAARESAKKTAKSGGSSRTGNSSAVQNTTAPNTQSEDSSPAASESNPDAVPVAATVDSCPSTGSLFDLQTKNDQ
jgi:PRTRC genetic system protein E